MKFPTLSFGPLYRLLPLLALLCAAPAFSAQNPPPAAAGPVPLTSEQKAAVDALDIRLAGVETLVQKVTDAKYRAELDRAIKDFQERRDAMARNFDQGLYDNLMHAIISRYQTVALWLKPPLVPPPGAKKAENKSAR